MRQCGIPSGLQFSGHQPILGIRGFITALCQPGLITCLFEFERKALHLRLLLACGTFCGLQGSFDRATFDGTKYFSGNPLLGPGTGERDALLSTMDDVHSPAGVTDQIAAAGIVGVEHPAAPPASQEAGEQSVAPAARLARTPGQHEIVFAEHLLIALELLPRDIAVVMILYQDAPLVDGLPVTNGLPCPSLNNGGSGSCLAERISARKDGINQNAKDSMVDRLLPLNP